MRVSEMMSVRLVTCASTRTIAEAARLMVDTRVGSVLVCDGPRLEGILTERDVMRLVADRMPVDIEVVGHHMTRDFIAAPPDALVEDVAELMRTHRIRHMPIVEGEIPVGMISLRDFFVMAGEVLRHQGAEAAGGIVRAASG